jgi:hypothetical protein
MMALLAIQVSNALAVKIYTQTQATVRATAGNNNLCEDARGFSAQLNSSGC